MKMPEFTADGRSTDNDFNYSFTKERPKAPLIKKYRNQISKVQQAARVLESLEERTARQLAFKIMHKVIKVEL